MRGFFVSSLSLLALPSALWAQSFVQQPQGGTRYVGDGFALSCVATDRAPLSYQWFQNGHPLAGATNTQLFLSNLTVSNSGDYFVTVSNGTASITSASATLLVLADSEITRTIRDVRHVVIFMQENRSFDHYFGSLKGVRGFSDSNAIRLPNGAPAFFQPVSTNYVLPFHVTPQCLNDVEHDWDDGHEVWHTGRWDRWAQVNGPSAMAYYTRDDLSYYYALAESYTVCDTYHCSVLGPTNPNRLYLMSGMIDPRSIGGGPVTDNTVPLTGFTWTTYPERLQAAGVSWKVYQQASDIFSLNALTWFSQYRNASPGNPLYDRGVALVNNLVSAFQSDVSNGTLPRVSWIIPPWSLSEHPPFAPVNGEQLTKQLLDALASNPAVYNSTVFILTYDEGGGFFAHVPPPVPQPGTADEFVGGAPIGLGIRVPTILVSPWTRGGYVCSQIFDHTSILRFLEAWTGVREPNISAWRRQVCGDLTSAFNFAAPDTSYPSLPVVTSLICSNGTTPVAPSQQSLPVQEPGTLIGRPLPYQPNAVSTTDCGSGRLWIAMTNAAAESVHLALYANAYRTDGPWQYDVAASNTVSDSFNVIAYGGGSYDFTCYGPNGFQRRFAGNINTNCNQVEVSSSIDATAGTLALAMQNLTASTVVFTVTNGYPTGGPWTYSVPAGSTVTDTFPAVANNNGWYDLTATASNDPLFVRRLAGRIETVFTDFVLTAYPKILILTAGSNTTGTASIQALNGFSGIVTLNLTGLPVGVSASFNPPSITGSGTSTLSLAASPDVTLGDFPLTIVATSSNSPHTSTITLAVHAADSDGDGIPDWWTQQYFGHPTGQGSDRSQADQDADGTGQNNLFKYVAGLDPTNPTSVFSLSITNVANVPYLIFSPVVSGRLYTIQSSTTLQSSSWTPLPSVGGPVTNGNTVTVTDPNASPQREFYRLDITLP